MLQWSVVMMPVHWAVLQQLPGSWHVPVQQTPVGMPGHTAPSTTSTSAGHPDVDEPHVSAGSHAPVDDRHTKPLGPVTSAGQVVVDEPHVSAGSHAPRDGRHSKLPGRVTSAGQTVVDVPHVSATSH